MAEKTKYPKRVAGPPIRFVAVKYDNRFGRDPDLAVQLSKMFGIEIVADSLIVEILAPIHVDGAMDMAGVV
jgi:hypothetical protein